MALIAVLCLVASALAWLSLPSPWWMNPDFASLHAQVQACESPLAARKACEAAKVMARQALDALHACLGDQADVDGCAAVRQTAARQVDSLQQLVHSASVEPATRFWVIPGVAFNPWMRAARSADWQSGSTWPWVCVVLLLCCVVGSRVVYLRMEWKSQESRAGALRCDLDVLEQDRRKLERLVTWFDDLQSQLKAMQRSRYANLLPPADNGTGQGQREAPDLRTRFDQTFGAQPPAAPGGLIDKAMADDAAWRELGSPTRHAAFSGVRRLLHLSTGMLMRVSCHRTEKLGGGGGFWEFAVQLDGVEAGLPHRRPVELSADFLQSDWLVRVPHDKIAVTDWPAALAASKEWLEAVLHCEIGVEAGTLSMLVERRVREQYIGVQREKARRGAALRALRADMGCGWHLWCWQRLLHRSQMVSDVTFQVHDHSE